MGMNVHIADIEYWLTPANKKSRLHPRVGTLNRYPIVMDEDMKEDREMILSTIKRDLKGLVSDISKYSIRYKLSNVKFSTKCQWTKKE